MKDLFFFPYSLIAKHPLNAKSPSTSCEGVLLRVDGSFGRGYAALQPWVSLGDPPLRVCLEGLEGTSLGREALRCAAFDAQARSEGRSLFEGLKMPCSHRTLPFFDYELIEESLELGFGTVKLKLGADWKKDKSLLLKVLEDFPELSWRLDFNHTARPKDLMAYVKELPVDAVSRIDFLEDPFPYQAYEKNDWRYFQKQWGIDFASDQVTHREESLQAGWRIIKPAKQDPEAELQKAEKCRQSMTITSYMDHPLGQCYAAYCAAKYEVSEDCGLVTHTLFEGNAFSERLGPEQPFFCPPEGMGLGFDDLLEKLPWKALA